MKREGLETEIVFVTHSKGKYEEASNLAKGFGIRLVKGSVNKLELQANTLEEVASYAAIDAYQHLRRPLVVEDTGLFINSLQGFPGVYSSYVYRTIGLRGILKLLKRKSDRSAFFKTILVYCDDKHFVTFSGRVDGYILARPVGRRGFGFDPIFSPAKQYPTSYAQMPKEEKNRISHRSQAFNAFLIWYNNKILRI